MATKVNQEQLQELLYQALETETGGIEIYETAVKNAINKDLKQEWTHYLEQTRNHREVLLHLFEQLELDPDKQTPGRQVCKLLGESLVEAMKLASKSGGRSAGELVATECVVLAETKDHQNWELIAQVAEKCTGMQRELLQSACDEVRTDEHHHLYHTAGWSRELWLDSLGLPSVLPPPEEVKDVETAIGAARAEQSREKML